MNFLKTLLLLLLFFQTLAPSYADASEVDSILQSIGNAGDSAAVKTLMNEALPRLGPNPSEAARLLEQAQILALQNDDSLSWAASLCMNAFVLPDSLVMRSLEYYEKAIPILVKNNHRFQAQALSNAATILVDLGDYEQAITYQQMGLEYVLREGSERNQIALTTNLGYIYDRMHDYETAVEVHRKALPLAVEARDTFMLGLIHMRIAAAKDGNGDGDLDSALYYYQIALGLYQSIDDERRIAQTQGNIGNVLRLQGKPDEALSILNQAAQSNRSLGLSHPYTMNIINMGKAYVDKGEYTSALDTLNSGLRWSRKVDDRSFEMDALYSLYECQSAIGNYQQANSHLLRYTDLNDSIFNAEKAKQVANLQTRYETAEKERSIASLSAEKAQAELEASQQQNLLFAVIGGGIILLISGGFLFYYTRQRQEVILAQKEVQFQENLLSTRINSEEEERRRIAKELHDGIAQTLVSLKLRFYALLMGERNLSEEYKLEFETSIDSLDDACTEVRNISHQMMAPALLELGLISAMEELLQKSLGILGITYQFEYSAIKNKQLEQRIEIALYRICQELVQNIIKHSEASEVNVLLYEANSSLVLSVEDNGKGLPADEVAEGIGMMNINSRVAAIQGKVSFENGVEKGLIATVRIPLKQAASESQ